ncbi:MAG: sigma-70 family RNA polymerase sigma factor [Bacteroidales bacterium]|nr:sigma-70 family RNA polymerase sigma factor [Bacteroidales bacterium]
MHDYIHSDDKLLISFTLEGDQKAFGEIVRRYEKMVARTVKSMLGDIQQADDIGQEAFIRLYHSLADFRGDAKLSTYLQRIAINLSLNEIKRKGRYVSLFYQSDNDKEMFIDLPDNSSESSVDMKEILDMAVKKLTPEFRAVITLRLIQGYSTKETAEILGSPLGTVLSRLARAKEQLREIIEKLI